MFWGKLFEKFLPSFPWKVMSSKIFKKIKKVSNFLKCPKSFPKVSKRVLNVFGANFRKIFAQFSMECLVFKSFQKKIFSKFQKCANSFPKVSKRVLNVFWGNFFENFFAQCSVECQVFEKFQNFFVKFQKCPKVFPKVSKRVLNVFGANFRKIFAQFSMECLVFENFQKKKYFQNSKNAQNVLKSIQTCFEHVLWKIFRKIFSPVFDGMSSLRKFSKKIFSKFQKWPKVFPKVSKRVLG